jgi:hypothetical protein
VKIVNCLDTEYLLSLPRNFRGYKKGNFSDQVHSRHLWYRNAVRIVGWCNVRHEFPSAISSFIKQEVWPEQEINRATKIAEVSTDTGIPKALGRGNGWNELWFPEGRQSIWTPLQPRLACGMLGRIHPNCSSATTPSLMARDKAPQG